MFVETLCNFKYSSRLIFETRSCTVNYGSEHVRRNGFLFFRCIVLRSRISFYRKVAEEMWMRIVRFEESGPPPHSPKECFSFVSVSLDYSTELLTSWCNVLVRKFGRKKTFLEPKGSLSCPEQAVTN